MDQASFFARLILRRKIARALARVDGRVETDVPRFMHLALLRTARSELPDSMDLFAGRFAYGSLFSDKSFM
jgi:hypothetical protein